MAMMGGSGGGMPSMQGEAKTSSEATGGNITSESYTTVDNSMVVGGGGSLTKGSTGTPGGIAGGLTGLPSWTVAGLVGMAVVIAFMAFRK
jgi:hypothetical protein